MHAHARTSPRTHTHILQPRPPTAEISPASAEDSKAMKEVTAAATEAEDEGEAREESGAHAQLSPSGTREWEAEAEERKPATIV